jgi:hypothetical protein
MITRHWLGKYPSIEAAWRGYEKLISPRDKEEARLAFWSGASVLFYAMLRMFDPGDEPTDADLTKMDAINIEIEKFCSTFDAEVLKRHGGRQ